MQFKEIKEKNLLLLRINQNLK